MSTADVIARRVVPSIVLGLSQVDVHHRAHAALARARGGRGQVELFVAFDDPLSAVALLGLRDRLAGRRADLVVRPVVARGIPGDPAVDLKRAFAVEDAARLARRDGRELARTAPLQPQDTAALARRTAAIEDVAARAAFAAETMHRLWFAGGAIPATDDPGEDGAAGVTRCERLMARRGPYDTPAAVCGGQWFFAHERLPQIAHRLDELGWTVAP